MFAKFNQLGTQILTLMRRSGPMLYDVENKDAPIHFNHAEYKNICTLKSPCFIGDADEVVAFIKCFSFIFSFVIFYLLSVFI